MREQKKSEKAITLIALIISIIVLLILAGVSLTAIIGNNGILNQATNAAKRTEIASEEELLSQIVASENADKIQHPEVVSSYHIGEDLHERTLANGSIWNIVVINETQKVYDEGWTFIEKGTELMDYGESKYSWLVNYESGEKIRLEEGEYTNLDYSSSLAVTEGLILNVDPTTMASEEDWGEGVTLYGVEEGDGYGWNGTEFKFDGVDDYIEIYTDMSFEEGLTFEFYGKSYQENTYLLNKTVKDLKDLGWKSRFRTYQINNYFYCCMSNSNCNSDWVANVDVLPHWIRRDTQNSFNNENGGYLTMTVDLMTDTISLYWDGESIGSTVCSHDWLIRGGLTDSSIPFTVGLMISGDMEYTEGYSQMDLYSCRLYNQVLTQEEVKENYDKTVAYHTALTNQ